MLLQLLSKIIKFNKVIVLGVFKNEAGYMYNALTVVKTGTRLEVVQSARFDTIAKLIEELPGLPVLLCIDGKGVLHKVTDLHNETDVNWKKSMNFKDIYCTEYFNGNRIFLSFCRKDMADEIIDLLQQEGLQILDVTIGPLLSLNLSHHIGEDNIYVNSSCLEFKHGHLENISRAAVEIEKDYLVGDTSLNKLQLPLYGAAVSFFLKRSDFKTSKPAKIKAEEIVYKRAFNIFGVSIIVSFFLALLVSYLLIQYYMEKNAALTQQSVYSGQTYQNLINLENQIKQKRLILGETGQLSKNFASFYVYELSRSVPSSVQIHDLDIFPVVKEIKENTKVGLQSNVITIKGSASGASGFNAWLILLKKMSWIKNFEIIFIKKDKKDLQQFELKLLLKHV